MMEYLIELDKELFLFLNGLHHPVLDPVMWFLSGSKNWIPFYALLLLLIVKEFKKETILIITIIGLIILLSDQTTSGLMKPFFERYRPSHEASLQGLVYTLNDYRGGRFGFASSHAANSFALAVFIFLLFRLKYKWMWLIFVWASLVSYSRIYLGVHYPGDIIVGGLIGALYAYACYHLYLHLRKIQFLSALLRKN
jgi:undecaprenyl-diphosphatase